jgi:hypothetical protein
MAYVPRSQIRRSQRNIALSEDSDLLNRMTDDYLRRGEGSFSPGKISLPMGRISMGDFRGHLDRQVQSGSLVKTKRDGRTYYARR